MSKDHSDFICDLPEEDRAAIIMQRIAIRGCDTVLDEIESSSRLSDKEKGHLVRLAKTASEILLASDDIPLAFSHAGFALTALPYCAPKLPKGEIVSADDFGEALLWQRKGHNMTLQVASGYEIDGTPVGIPFGSKARLLLYYLQTRAIQSQSRFVDFGTSLKEWLGKQGISIGGKTYNLTRDQAKRISACRLVFLKENDGGTGRRNGQFVRTAIELKSKSGDARQGELWQEVVELDEDFYKDLVNHAVPLPAGAIKQLSDLPMALDILVWLTYRINHASKSGDRIEVPWASLFAQFGFSYAKSRQFKPEFIKNLQLAHACIPDARIEVNKNVNGGLILKPSPSLLK